MRRIIIFLTLALALLGMVHLNQMAGSWHYVVPAEDGELLYATSFDGAMDDWLQDERGSFSHVVDDGVLRIVANVGGVGPYSTLRPHFSRFDFSVQAQIIEGDFAGGNNNAFGVIFRRASPRDYYAFLISGDGYYRILREVNGVSREISTWHPSDAIEQEAGAVNHLRVVGVADRFAFYVNDTRLSLCIPDDPDGASTINSFTGECVAGTWQETLTDTHHPSGQLGVVVSADAAGRPPTGQPVIVEFDNAIIRGASDFTEETP